MPVQKCKPDNPNRTHTNAHLGTHNKHRKRCARLLFNVCMNICGLRTIQDRIIYSRTLVPLPLERSFAYGRLSNVTNITLPVIRVFIKRIQLDIAGMWSIIFSKHVTSSRLYSQICLTSVYNEDSSLIYSRCLQDFIYNFTK